MFIGVDETEKGNRSATDGEGTATSGLIDGTAVGVVGTVIVGAAAVAVLATRAARFGPLAVADTPACPGSLILLNTSASPVGSEVGAIGPVGPIFDVDEGVTATTAAGATNVCHGVFTTGFNC